MHAYVAYSVESKIYQRGSPATAEGTKENLLNSFALVKSWACEKGGA